jgi:26S proteasome regulatory subunit N1
MSDAQGEEAQGTPDEVLSAKLQKSVALACTGPLDERLSALSVLADELRAADTLESRIPRALRHLLDSYDALASAYATFTHAGFRARLADILSYVAISRIDSAYDLLLYRLASPIGDIGHWGHTYVRCLAENLIRANAHRADLPPGADYGALVEQIARYFISHQDEPCGCDLLMEVGRLDDVVAYVDADTYARVATYLLQCYDYLSEPANFGALRTVGRIYLALGRTPEAVMVALKLNDRDLVRRLYFGCTDAVVRTQLAFQLARQLILFDDDEDLALVDIMANFALGTRFLEIAKLLGCGTVRTPDEILQLQATLAPRTDRKRKFQSLQLIAKSLVSAFHNASLKQDNYYLADRGDDCVNHNRKRGVGVAVASLGMLYLWDITGGAEALDRWLRSPDPMHRAGALVGLGVISSSVRSTCDPILAYVEEQIESDSADVAIGILFALALSYAGTLRTDVCEIMCSVRTHHSADVRVLSFLSLAIGLLYVGSCEPDCLTELLDNLLRVVEDIGDNLQFLPLLALGHGLVFLGQQRACLEHLAQLDETMSDGGSHLDFIKTTIISCAYAGTGNVIEIQRNLTTCTGPDSIDQAAAVLGIAVIAIGDRIGMQMARRTLEQVLQYGKPFARRMAPIALALTAVSNPLPELIDNLHRIGRDPDSAVAKNAGIGLGLIGAGTMNPRVRNVLGTLANFHKEQDATQMIMQIAEGLVTLGQGLLTLAPTYGDGMLLNPVALGSLLVVANATIQTEKLFASEDGDPWLFYFVAPAIAPRFLATVVVEVNGEGPEAEKNLVITRVPVKVGTAVDVVGQAGKPKMVSGFQQLDTPVIIAAGQKAETVDDTWEPLSPILEGFVVVRKKSEDAKPE